MVSDLASSPVLGPFEAIWGPGKKRGRPPVVRYWSDTVPRRGPDALVPHTLTTTTTITTASLLSAALGHLPTSRGTCGTPDIGLPCPRQSRPTIVVWG